MTSFGGPEDYIDFLMTVPNAEHIISENPRLIKAGANPLSGTGFEKLAIQLPNGQWVIGGGGGGHSGSFGQFGMPAYDDDPSNPKPDTNHEQKMRILYEKVKAANAEKNKDVAKDAILKAFDVALGEGLEYGLELALELATSLPGFLTGSIATVLLSSSETSEQASDYSVYSVSKVIFGSGGNRIGKLTVSKTKSGKILFTVYSTNPNPKGSFFKSTTDPDKVSSHIQELKEHAEDDTPSSDPPDSSQAVDKPTATELKNDPTPSTENSPNPPPAPPPNQDKGDDPDPPSVPPLA